ncbi:MAG: hypothetical protein AAF851_06290 [Myxococcota bacterium]
MNGLQGRTGLSGPASTADHARPAHLANRDSQDLALNLQGDVFDLYLLNRAATQADANLWAEYVRSQHP